MRHHERLIAMRRCGQKPTAVHLLTQSCPRRLRAEHIPPDWVFVEPSDSIPLLDLRFLVGCLVLVDGEDAVRVRQLLHAARRQGARRVIAHVVAPRGETFDILEILDTEQALSWHA